MGNVDSTPSLPAPQAPAPADMYFIRQRGRAFAVQDPAGDLVCVAVYLRGAFEVVRRLGGVGVYAREKNVGPSSIPPSK